MYGSISFHVLFNFFAFQHHFKMSKQSYNLPRTTYDNTDAVLSPEGKKRRSQTDLDCILDAGRLIIRGGKQLATMIKDQLFHQFFGCGAIVALSLCNLLKAENQSVPAASIEHMMWALLFLKA
jgi:hypothetical protein